VDANFRHLERQAACGDEQARLRLIRERDRACGHEWGEAMWPKHGSGGGADHVGFRCSLCHLSRDHWVQGQLDLGEIVCLLPVHRCHPTFMTPSGTIKVCCMRRQGPILSYWLARTRGETVADPGPFLDPAMGTPWIDPRAEARGGADRITESTEEQRDEIEERAKELMTDREGPVPRMAAEREEARRQQTRGVPAYHVALRDLRDLRDLDEAMVQEAVGRLRAGCGQAAGRLRSRGP